MPRAPRMKCAFAEPDVPKIKKARAAAVKLTPEEKEEKKALAKARAAVKEKKKQWEETLKPWGSRDGRGVPFMPGTKAQFKSDAKKAFGLNDKEIASLPFMDFSGSSKTIYRLTDCKALADRKRVALGNDAFDYPAREIMGGVQPTKEKAMFMSLANLLGEPDHTVTVQGTSLNSLSGRREKNRFY
ncbi:uncharacterized protein B0H18DRAFT_642841 [Fomitopsis serialis]|uniref:uncharacterized protein n=1 Tax=Fomitopsis serialis TaxID=139415 RepID=UPI00200825D6|nr:uncharacterized protein B0H18DRAFT_642841 [Neoantrodia serialis]KAH9933358.1 hypothetical protein B0H18DRAFT_642841 [Neoantrodia serialis]